MGHRAGVWIVAAAFIAAMAFSTVPTPLWPLYQTVDRFPTSMITVAFATYAVGAVASLFLVGHTSDWVGRRRILLPALLLEAVAAAVFACYPQLPGLLTARLISGIGVGMLTAAATAHLGDLHRIARPQAPAASSGRLAIVANLGGLAAGPVLGGLLTHYLNNSLSTVHLVFFGLLVVCTAAVALVPETGRMPAQRPSYRPQRVAVPMSARKHYVGVTVAAFAAFALFGLVTSLASKILAVTLEVHSPVVSGLVCSSVLFSSTLAQLPARSLGERRQLETGVVALVLGMVVLATAGPLESFTVFLIGGLLAGAGAGVLFKEAMQTAAKLAVPGKSGESVAGVFLASYLGLTVPVVALGVAAEFVPLTVGMIAFSTLIVILVITAWTVLRTPASVELW